MEYTSFKNQKLLTFQSSEKPVKQYNYELHQPDLIGDLAVVNLICLNVFIRVYCLVVFFLIFFNVALDSSGEEAEKKYCNTQLNKEKHDSFNGGGLHIQL